MVFHIPAKAGIPSSPDAYAIASNEDVLLFTRNKKIKKWSSELLSLYMKSSFLLRIITKVIGLDIRKYI